MAQKRMFSIEVVATDRFLELPTPAQSLYFQLCMRADDEGFVSSPKILMRSLGVNSGTYKKLVENRYILEFDSGVVAIKDWFVNNTIRGDKSRKSRHVKERERVEIADDGTYEFVKKAKKKRPSADRPKTAERPSADRRETAQGPSADRRETAEKPSRIEENRIEKNSIEEREKKERENRESSTPTPDKKDLSSYFPDLVNDDDASLPREECERLREEYDKSLFAYIGSDTSLGLRLPSSYVRSGTRLSGRSAPA